MIDAPCAHPVLDRLCGRGANSIDLGLPLCWQHEQSVIERVDTRPDRRKRRHQNRYAAREVQRLVYYVRRADGAIKIGFTRNLNGRLRTMRNVCPVELLATQAGGHQVEQKLHRVFHLHRLDGEWFAPTDPLLAHIEKIARKAKQVAA